LRDRRYFQTIPQRAGVLPPLYQRTAADCIWLHAVSVGEVLSSVTLIRHLKQELPGAGVFVSCSTLAGRDAAASKLESMVNGVFYAPFDYVAAVRRVLRRIRPAVVIVLETEIWPNLYREVKRSGAALVIVNGRISPRTAGTYRHWRWCFSHVLALPDTILAQSSTDRDHYLRAGASPDRVYVGGNLKYDFDPRVVSAPAEVAGLLDTFGPLWIAASTVAPEYEGDVDEDDAVINAYLRLSALHADLRLVIAPRKPERFDVVAEKLARAGIVFKRRSHPTGRAAAVLLLDSIGELSSLFPQAMVVFMGGTLADRGGHNILEPAFFSLPIVAGPHLENFAEIEKHFVASNALARIATAADLAPAIDRLLRDRDQREALGERARQAAESQRGATRNAVAAIVEHRWSALPRAIPYGPLKPATSLLAWAWSAGGRWKRRWSERTQQSLSTPVISVGGIAMGGVGKTPFVAYLARKLHERGIRCAILTRGYRRRVSAPCTIVAAGTEASVDVTGDEPQILLRAGVAHLGIGADRYYVGCLLERQLQPDVFLLDDGFQHARLRRDLDIVLLDGLDPFAGGDVFPIGRLREPIEALSRADAIFISRAEGRRFDSVVERIRQVNSNAPVYLSCVRPVAWRELRGSAPLSLDAFAGRRVFAFCSLANPAAFWSSLHDLQCVLSGQMAFPDHHTYTAADLHRISYQARRAGAEVLVTTEKDVMNLPSTAFDLPVCWLEIKISVDGEQKLLALVERAMARSIECSLDLPAHYADGPHLP
jgi:3-deoxy-D-manno-octulosonic-acid transferase